MRLDPVSRLEKINEAMVNLFERSRAAEREAQRAANRQPVAISDGGGLDRGAARASQQTGTTMVTGRDGKLYPQGADPTRAQPGSALANQPAPQSREDAFLAAQPKMKRPVPAAPAAKPTGAASQEKPSVVRPAAAPTASAPTDNLDALEAARQNLTNVTKREMKAATDPTGIQRPSYTPSPESLPSAPTFSGMAKGTAAQGLFDRKRVAPSPAQPTPTSGRQPIQPGSLPQIEKQLGSGPSTTQTSGQGKGSLEQDLQSMGGILRNVGLLPSSGGRPKSPATPAATTSSASAPNFVEATPEERAASASAIARNANKKEQMRNAMGGTPSESEQARRDRNAALMDKLNPQSKTPNPSAFRIPQGTASASGFGAATSPKQPDMESKRAAAATNIVSPQTREREQLTRQPDMESKRAAATNIIATQSAQRRNMGGSASGSMQATPGF